MHRAILELQVALSSTVPVAVAVVLGSAGLYAAVLAEAASEAPSRWRMFPPPSFFRFYRGVVHPLPDGKGTFVGRCQQRYQTIQLGVLI